MEKAGQGLPCAGHFLLRAKGLTISTDIKKADHIGLLFKIWWVVQGSNLRPSPCKGDALPAELSTQEYSCFIFPVQLLSNSYQL